MTSVHSNVGSAVFALHSSQNRRVEEVEEHLKKLCRWSTSKEDRDEMRMTDILHVLSPYLLQHTMEGNSTHNIKIKEYAIR